MAGPKIGGSAMKHLTFNWDSEDKYSKLKTSKLKVNNILSTYYIPQVEQLAMIKNWLGRKGLQFLETLTNVEKVTCDTLEGLFNMLTSKFSPQINEIIKLLQFRKLCRNDGENVEEWMGRLRVAAIECNYQEVDRQLKEQFIHELNDKNMLEEIIKELMTVKSDEEITSGNVLALAKRVETQKVQAAVMSAITESKQFNTIKVSRPMRTSSPRTPAQHSTPSWPAWRYCGSTHPPRQCQAYGKTGTESSKVGHFC